MSTVLSLVQSAAYESQVDAPSTLVSLTNTSDLQILNLFYAVGRDLRQCNCWPQLKRQHTIYLQAGRNQYPLPNDFFSALPDTYWDQQNRWAMRGPLSDAGWNYRRYGYVTVENRKAFRVFGPDMASSSNLGQGGQVMIDPIPGASSAGQAITFEYLSKNWINPPAFAASTSYTTASYVTVNGNIYKSASSASSGSAAPSVGFNGVGKDGGVYWMVLYTPAWVLSTLYAPGDYVTNGGNLYVCTTGGTSASSGGPSGTGSSSITDGTVSWSYCASSSWTGQTTFAAGSFIKISSTYYKAVTPPNTLSSAQITGKVQPNWSVATPTTTPVWSQSDGTVTWNYFSNPYESIILDTDTCLFDDDIMILGLKWRFLQAKRQEFADFQAEYELKKKRAVSRWNAGQRIDLAGGSVGRIINVPEGSFSL